MHLVWADECVATIAQLCVRAFKLHDTSLHKAALAAVPLLLLLLSMRLWLALHSLFF
jgi:hypothetical protein